MPELDCKIIFNAKVWYKKGTEIKHRTDGPAVEDPNVEVTVWYKDGLRHREDGPAWENSFENKKIWYYLGKRIPVDNQADFKRYINLLNFQ